MVTGLRFWPGLQLRQQQRQTGIEQNRGVELVVDVRLQPFDAHFQRHFGRHTHQRQRHALAQRIFDERRARVLVGVVVLKADGQAPELPLHRYQVGFQFGRYTALDLRLHHMQPAALLVPAAHKNCRGVAGLTLAHRGVTGTENQPVAPALGKELDIDKRPVFVRARVALHFGGKCLAVLGALSHQPIEGTHRRPARDRAIIHLYLVRQVELVRRQLVLGKIKPQLGRLFLGALVVVEHLLLALFPQIHVRGQRHDGAEVVNHMANGALGAADRVIFIKHSTDTQVFYRAVRRPQVLDRF
uniref:hypothetical protein n=1 Tax=Serratia marcescens TaxID=615 RepID=UPI002816262C|nr:hypothetical protein [Serratia marcescens]